MRILVVEDEPRVSSLLERGLREEGHEPQVVASRRAADLALLGAGADTFDLLLVDRMLPDGDGLELVRALRERGMEVPVLVLTARDQVGDRVDGLYGGADDYLTKPFAFDELLARITSVCRRSRRGSVVLTVDDLVVDLGRRHVSRSGQEVHLTAQEFKLLRFLAENRGLVQSKSRLLEAVWDTHHDPGTNVVEVYISYLRTKVDKGFDRPLIHTVRGHGYVLEVRDP